MTWLYATQFAAPLILIGWRVWLPAPSVLGFVAQVLASTGEPHLHIHAQGPGSTDAPWGGDPRPIQIPVVWSLIGGQAAFRLGVPRTGH